MTQTVIMTILKTTGAYILVLILARLMGRKLISEMTFFNYITGVTLGTLMAILIIGTKYTSIEVAIALLTLTALTVTGGWISLKYPKLSRLINSDPTPMIEDGKILTANLKRSRVSLSQLLMLLREKDAFNIADVEFAIMEPDGKLSVLLKSQKQPLTPSELNIATPYRGLTADLIIEGQIQTANLKRVNLDETWLTDQLQAKGVNNLEEIFYAGLDTSGNLYISVQKHP